MLNKSCTQNNELHVDGDVFEYFVFKLQHRSKQLQVWIHPKISFLKTFRKISYTIIHIREFLLCFVPNPVVKEFFVRIKCCGISLGLATNIAKFNCTRIFYFTVVCFCPEGFFLTTNKLKWIYDLYKPCMFADIIISNVVIVTVVTMVVFDFFFVKTRNLHLFWFLMTHRLLWN